MRKIFLILCLSIYATSILAQKSLIDERNGFKSIKLGSKKSSFDNLTLRDSLEGWTSYLYYPYDRDLFNVFDKNYDGIILFFDKGNSLALITITKVFDGKNFYQDALNYSNGTIEKFVRVFGKIDQVDPQDNSGNTGVTWYGKKAFFMVETRYFGIAKGGAESRVVIGKTINLSSGF